VKSTIPSAVNKATYYLDDVSNIDIKKHAKQHDENIRALCNAILSGSNRHVRKCIYRILNSYSSKLTCLVLSLKKEHSAEDLCEMAQNLDPRKQCTEFLGYMGVMKSSGEGRRNIYLFGIKRRALHRLCTEIMEVIHPLSERVYLKKGMGDEKAANEICRLIDGGKCTYFILIDIKDFLTPCSTTECEKCLNCRIQ